MNPKVSILVPIYGVEKFIERCAVSLFEQTFEDIEYIFVNDCTPDDSVDVLNKTLERYPTRKSQVKIINHKLNIGLAGARNTGVENSVGDYLLHVDSDDYLELNAIEILYRKAIHDNAEIVISDYYIEWTNTMTVVKQNIYTSHKTDLLNNMLSCKMPSPLWNKLIKRNLYIQNNITATNGINLGEDYMVAPKLIFFANKISQVDEALYYYCQTNSNSYTNGILTKSNVDNLLFVLENLNIFFKSLPNFKLYKNALIQGQFKKKMYLLFYSESRYISEIFHKFPESNNHNYLDLSSKRDRISFALLNRGFFMIFNIYRKIYIIMHNFKKIISK